MHDKICVITGATSGIGRAAASALARQGLHVVAVARDRARGEALVAEIGAPGRGSAALEVADLSSISEVRRLAERLAALPRIDVLVNNAGLIVGERRVTVDGLEETFAVNHLAYFQLTTLLLERLKASAPARVVNVASDAHRRGTIDFDDLQGERGYGAWRAYAQSKLANVLFTYELARRLDGSGVTANCLHPGVVATGFGRSGGWLVRGAFSLMKPFLIGAEKGAETTIYLASSPEVERVSGQYFVERRPTRSSEESYDREVAARLWAVSEALVSRVPSGAHAR